MRVFLNGESQTIRDAVTVSQLLHDLGLGDRRVAVEVNQEIVPRSQHGAYRLHDDDRIEVVRAVGGG